MSFVNLVIKRGISTTTVCCGKRNFKKFPIYGKRGSRYFKQKQHENPDPNLLDNKRGVREIGYKIGDKFITIPEMVPELVVPDLTNFQLKPYISYRAPDVIQSEFTAKDLFNVVYTSKIVKDLQEGKLNDDGSPKEPSNEEKLSSDEALIKARQTGSDIF